MLSSDICFLLNQLNIFIIKNIDTQLVLYIIYRQKEIIRLLDIIFFKVVTTNNIWSYIKIFNPYFVNTIKNFNIDKTYKKS